MAHQNLAIDRPCLWISLLTVLLIAFVPFSVIGFKLSPFILIWSLSVPSAWSTIAFLLNQYSDKHNLTTAAEGVAQLSIIGLIGIMTVYSASVFNMPLVDRQLLIIDQFINYDWKSFSEFCSSRPWLIKILKSSYSTNISQAPIIAIALCFFERQDKFQRFAIAMLIGSLLTSIIFLLFPATTAWTYLNQERLARFVSDELPLSSSGWIHDLNVLRDGGGRLILGASGIVAFPSHHCVTALLNIWACWSFKYARIPVLILNIFMIVSALICGGHYMVDLLAGVAVALASVALSQQIYGWLLNIHLPQQWYQLGPQPRAL
ncbi:phosphatase PAP2 family protein [Sphingobium sp. AN558]|uniref:phosphatase PAP2 family protein n=1 Tax=Sphingobium sp. AN558 TaxID=3133442 RepID=UPI0030BBEAA6